MQKIKSVLIVLGLVVVTGVAGCATVANGPAPANECTGNADPGAGC